MLEQSLSVLEAIAHRFCDVVAAEKWSRLLKLSKRVISPMTRNTRRLSQKLRSIRMPRRSPFAPLRFCFGLALVTQTVTQALLKFSIDEDGDIRKEAIDSLKKVAAYDLNVFYGDDQQGGIGGHLEKQILGVISGLRDAGAD